MENEPLVQISNYESYQREVTLFWDIVNELQGTIKYTSQSKIRSEIKKILEKFQTLSEKVPLLENGKKYRNNRRDADIKFHEIYFLVLIEIKERVGTAILDEENICFPFPAIIKN